MDIQPSNIRGALESGLEDDAVELAKSHGWFTRKLQWIGRVGSPDRIFYGHGRVVFVEFKRPSGGRRSPAQKREIARMRKAGLGAYFCKDMAHFREILGVLL